MTNAEVLPPCCCLHASFALSAFCGPDDSPPVYVSNLPKMLSQSYLVENDKGLRSGRSQISNASNQFETLQPLFPY